MRHTDRELVEWVDSVADAATVEELAVIVRAQRVSNIAAQLKPLIQAGYISYTRGPDNRRVIAVTTTGRERFLTPDED